MSRWPPCWRPRAAESARATRSRSVALLLDLNAASASSSVMAAHSTQVRPKADAIASAIVRPRRDIQCLLIICIT